MQPDLLDRKSTRLNSSHVSISYAVFCLKKKKKNKHSSSNMPTTHHSSLNEHPQHHNLHSFPTRRSSDLDRGKQEGAVPQHAKQQVGLHRKLLSMWNG